MKKILMIICLALLLVGCNKKDNNVEIIENNPYHQELMNVNNNNGGLVVEDEEYIYFIEVEGYSGESIYKMDKSTKKIEEIFNETEVVGIQGLRIFNNKLYFLGIVMKDESNYEVFLYSMEKDGGKLVKEYEVDQNIWISTMSLIDNYLYYQTSDVKVAGYTTNVWKRYDLITKKTEVLDTLNCSYVYDNEENIICLIKDDMKGGRLNIDLVGAEINYLNKNSLEVELIKVGLFRDVLMHSIPTYINNTFYYENQSDINIIGKTNLDTSEQIMYDLDSYLEKDERMMTFIPNKDIVFITTEINGRFNTPEKEDYTTINRLYYFKESELVKVYEGYSNMQWSNTMVNLTEDYVFFWLNGDREKPDSMMKIFDYEGNEININFELNNY